MEGPVEVNQQSHSSLKLFTSQNRAEVLIAWSPDIRDSGAFINMLASVDDCGLFCHRA